MDYYTPENLDVGLTDAISDVLKTSHGTLEHITFLLTDKNDHFQWDLCLATQALLEADEVNASTEGYLFHRVKDGLTVMTHVGDLLLKVLEDFDVDVRGDRAA